MVEWSEPNRGLMAQRTRVPARPARSLLASIAIAMVWLCACAEPVPPVPPLPPPPPVLPADAVPAILALIDDVGFERPQPDGLVVDSAQVQRDRVRFEVHRAEALDGPALATLTLLPLEAAEAADARSTSFALRIEPGADPSAGLLLQRLVASVQGHDRGDIYVRPKVVVPVAAPIVAALVWDVHLLQAAIAALVLALFGSLAMLWRRGLPLAPPRIEVRVTHLLPAALQCTIFLYWSLYWRDLGPRVFPLIAMELVAALVFDALLELWTARRFVLSSGALPIVLSTNLFVVFEPGAIALALAAIALALVSRRWVRAGDRHVFNPSVFGLTIVGIASLILPQIGYGDTAYEFSLSPNATELVLVLATIVQLRLPLVLVSFGAFFGLLASSALLGGVAFEPTWAPIALVLTLLVTDPATIPRRPATRLLFGLLAGLSMRVAGEVMHGIFALDNFAKVTGVFIANGSAVLALRATNRWGPLAAPRRRWRTSGRAARPALEPAARRALVAADGVAPAHDRCEIRRARTVSGDPGAASAERDALCPAQSRWWRPLR